MDVHTLDAPTTSAQPAEHFDVLVVGAGISGIGAAYHLQQQCPTHSFAVLEALPSYGGTWLTHTYPGIRSDSDLYTFGYRFKPWVDEPIATADKIMRYLGEVISENDLARHIRYNHRILTASFSRQTNRWTLEAERTDTGERRRFTCTFLWMCQGYYRQYDGYTPEWPGMGDYKGRIVHPEKWPDDIDLKGKRVVCIGSGATAATVVPAIAADVEHVTLVQRSPTYFLPAPNVDELADQLRVLKVDESWIHEISRRKRLHDQAELTRRCLEEPDAVRDELLAAVTAFVGEEEVRKNFTPRYRPWQQRLAYVPDGDLFQGIVAGKAGVVTGEIDRFTEKGIRLKSGEEIEADVVITATGFNLNVLGDIDFTVDGQAVNFADSITYRGMMFTGLPNLLWIFGYFRASWTLRVDLLADFTCRLLNHMRDIGAERVEVALRPEDRDMKLLPWIDPDNFNPGYLMRGLHLLPRRGEKPEWAHTQDYWREKEELPAIDLDGSEFAYDRKAAAAKAA